MERFGYSLMSVKIGIFFKIFDDNINVTSPKVFVHSRVDTRTTLTHSRLERRQLPLPTYNAHVNPKIIREKNINASEFLYNRTSTAVRYRVVVNQNQRFFSCFLVGRSKAWVRDRERRSAIVIHDKIAKLKWNSLINATIWKMGEEESSRVVREDSK